MLANKLRLRISAAREHCNAQLTSNTAYANENYCNAGQGRPGRLIVASAAPRSATPRDEGSERKQNASNQDSHARTPQNKHEVDPAALHSPAAADVASRARPSAPPSSPAQPRLSQKPTGIPQSSSSLLDSSQTDSSEEQWPSQQPLPPTPLSPATARVLARTFRAGDLAFASAAPLRLWCKGPATRDSSTAAASTGGSASGAASRAALPGGGAAGVVTGNFPAAGGQADEEKAAPRQGLAPAPPPDALLLAPAGAPRDISILVAAIERLLQRPPPRGCVGCLVLAPSRERAAALHEAAFALLAERGGGAAVGDSMHVQVAHGGAPFRDDVSALRANPPQLLVATPGRMGQLMMGGGGAAGGGGAGGGGRRGGRQQGEVRLGHLFSHVQLLLLDGADAVAASPELRCQLEALLRQMPGSRLAPAAPPPLRAGAAARDGGGCGGGGHGGGDGGDGPVLVLAAAAPDAAGQGGVQLAVSSSATASGLSPALQALTRIALRPGFAVVRAPSLAAVAGGPITVAGSGGAARGSGPAAALQPTAAAVAAGLQPGAGGQCDSLAAAVTAALSLPPPSSGSGGAAARQNMAPAPAAAAAQPPAAAAAAQQQSQPQPLLPQQHQSAVQPPQPQQPPALQPPPLQLPLHVLPVSYGEHLSYLYVLLRQHMIAEARHKMLVQLPSAALASLYARVFQSLGFPAAEAHGRTPPATREAAVRAFLSGPRGLLFTTPGAGPGLLGGGGLLGSSSPSLVVWVGPPPPTQLAQQLAALQQSAAATAASSALDLALLPPQLQQQQQPLQQQPPQRQKLAQQQQQQQEEEERLPAVASAPRRRAAGMRQPVARAVRGLRGAGRRLAWRHDRVVRPAAAESPGGSESPTASPPAAIANAAAAYGSDSGVDGTVDASQFVAAEPAAAPLPPPPPRCLLLLTGLEQYTHARAQHGPRGRIGGGGSGGNLAAAATDAVLAATDAALSAGGLGPLLVLQPGSWTVPLEAVQRRVAQAVPKVPLPLKQRALEGLLGHLWAAAAAPAVAAHSAGRGSSRSRVPDTPPQSQQQRAQPLQLQPPARPGAAADGRRTGPGSTAAHGPLTPGQLGMAARAFATVMAMPQPLQLSRSAAAAMGLSHIPGVTLRAPAPPTLPKPPGRPPRPQRHSKRQIKLRRERRKELRMRLGAAAAPEAGTGMAAPESGPGAVAKAGAKHAD